MNDNPEQKPAALSKAEAAKALGVSERTVDRCIACGELRAIRLGRRVLVPRIELERLLAGEPA